MNSRRCWAVVVTGMPGKPRSPQVLKRPAHKCEERALERAEKKLAHILKKHKNPDASSEESTLSDSSLLGGDTVTSTCKSTYLARKTSTTKVGEDDCFSQVFKDGKGNDYTCRTNYFECDGKQMVSRQIWPNSLKPRLMEVNQMKRIVRNKMSAEDVRKLIVNGGNVDPSLPSKDEHEPSYVEGSSISIPTVNCRLPLNANVAGFNLDMDLKVKVGDEKARDVKMRLEMPNFEMKRVMIDGQLCAVYEH
uniref:SHSP domain-containing protein n=1 Tax=Steinernema glaseri TaxID=37863 RepID=A0A1I8AMH4_9BILA